MSLGQAAQHFERQTEIPSSGMDVDNDLESIDQPLLRRAVSKQASPLPRSRSPEMRRSSPLADKRTEQTTVQHEPTQSSDARSNVHARSSASPRLLRAALELPKLAIPTSPRDQSPQSSRPANNETKGSPGTARAASLSPRSLHRSIVSPSLQLNTKDIRVRSRSPIQRESSSPVTGRGKCYYSLNRLYLTRMNRVGITRSFSEFPQRRS